MEADGIQWARADRRRIALLNYIERIRLAGEEGDIDAVLDLSDAARSNDRSLATIPYGAGR